MEQEYNFMVCVQCFTYNHSQYIVEAMNGFTMQTTIFPFVCCIVDDNSTDGEQEVIRKYLKKYFDLEEKSFIHFCDTEDYESVFARHKDNNNCYFAIFFLKHNHYSNKELKFRRYQYIEKWSGKAKYIALCEGDDYWTDPLKLQKQFRYMETNKGVSMCFHAHRDLYPDGTTIDIIPEKDKKWYTIHDIIAIKDNRIGTNTVFFRNEYLQKEGLPDFWRECPVGDIPLRLYLASKGLIGIINDNMSVYRKEAYGSWTTRKISLKQRINHRKKMIKTFVLYDRYTQRVCHSDIKKVIKNIIVISIKDMFLTPFRILRSV